MRSYSENPRRARGEATRCLPPSPTDISVGVGRVTWTLLQNIAEALAAAAATGACAIRARRERGAAEATRANGESTWVAWALISAGLGAWTLGQIGWTIVFASVGEVLIEVSPLDGAFLLSPLLIVAGLLKMVNTPAGYLSKLRAVSEGLFIAAGLLLLSWTLVVGSVAANASRPPFAQAVNLAYPLLDVVALASVLFVSFWRRLDRPPGLGLLAVGIGCMAVADSAFWYSSEAASNFSGSTAFDYGWIAAFALIALGALRPIAEEISTPTRRARRALLALPALPAVVGVSAMATRWTLGAGLGAPGGALLAILAVVVVLAAGLLISVICENDALRDDLERKVTERTAELHAAERQYRALALHDPLTGASNRALLDDRAAQAFARARRNDGQVAAIAIDLDAFKLVNERIGRCAADEILRAVAQRLEAATRPEDTIARMGGDEFLVLIDHVDGPEMARAIAERIHRSIHPPFDLTRGDLALTASVGVSVGSPSTTSFEQLVSDADVAMYAVKAGGKDAAQLFQPSMQKRAREHLRLQSELRSALEGDELWLFYQPQFDIATGELGGFEALVRWNHPVNGLLAPSRFIELAETSGLIVALGRWVLNQALRQAVVWDELEGNVGTDLSIAVNVSAVQLKAPGLLTDVRDALARTGIAPQRVVLEITESSLIEDPHHAIQVLHALKQLGVSIAIDDFGTGYASLAYLQRMPVDILKIDKTFIANSSARGRELLEAIVGIGRTLALLTVAEGIEQPAQLEMVRSFGCDLAQGYLLGKPLPADEGQGLIERQRTARAAPAAP